MSSLLDRYLHKIMYSWLLPGFNKHLSKMLNDFWDQTPHHTNLVETTHAGTNQSTNVHLQPLEAIQWYVIQLTFWALLMTYLWSEHKIMTLQLQCQLWQLLIPVSFATPITVSLTTLHEQLAVEISMLVDVVSIMTLMKTLMTYESLLQQP